MVNWNFFSLILHNLKIDELIHKPITLINMDNLQLKESDSASGQTSHLILAWPPAHTEQGRELFPHF